MNQLQRPPIHPLWGLPLHVYLTCTNNQAPILLPHLDDINNSLELLSTGEPTCEALELCLSLSGSQSELKLIMRQGLLPGCMAALRRYCNENPLITHAFGLLCLRMLALITQVALLECVNPQNLTSADDGVYSHSALTRNVALVVQSWMAPKYDYPMKQKRHLRDLQWFEDSVTNQLTCLPKVGGMTSNDIEFLLNTLSANSELCQHLFRTFDFQGYCALLFVVWQKLLRINPIISQAAQLGNLVFRYWIRAYKIEHGLLRYMFMWSVGRLRDAGSPLRLTANSEGDLRAVVEAFIDKTYVPDLPSMDSMATHDVAGLTDFVVDAFKPEVYDMAIPVLETLLSRVWVEIEDGDPPDNEAIIRLTNYSLRLLSRKFLKDLDWAALLALLLDEIDLINLLGRVLLLHLDVSGDETRFNPIVLFGQRVTAIMRALRECAPELVAYSFNEKLDDWLKTFRWISSQHIAGTDLEPMQSQLRRKDVWMEIGAALGYDDMLLPCANPRCAGGEYATLVCEICRNVAYCSVDCHMSHWSTSGRDEHCRTCRRNSKQIDREYDGETSSTTGELLT
ncbi:unnamed protein product [Rhizoctonia solani]|uniref:MYND-type domain-containing protein n=1 Tax=Rhizoctonia solani TaxID=456999 RepID=A0A8H3E1J3_9AGAM|nr:unnamed protein product [Rhizoctonia solani]